MENKTIIIRWFGVVALLLFTCCERPLYFASSENQMFNRLEKGGDIQGEMAISQAFGYVQNYQASGAVALSKHLALRGSIIQGGDDFRRDRLDYGRFSAARLGIGGMYQIQRLPIYGSTWLGYSEGTVVNTNNASLFGSEPQILRLTNSFRRIFIEQQIRYPFHGIELYGSLCVGNSRLFGFNLEGVPNPESDFQRDYLFHTDNPSLTFASVGYGLSGGSRNIRLNARIDQFFGPGMKQLDYFGSFLFTTSVSFRLEGAYWWGRLR